MPRSQFTALGTGVRSRSAIRAMRRTRRRIAFLVVGGLLLLVGPPVAWWLLQPPATVGEVLPAAVPPQQAEVGEPRPEAQPERDHRLAEPAPNGAHPLGIVIPAIGVDNPVVEVGLNPDMSMEIPDDVQDVGWYTPTDVRPGDPGSAVLAGHVDSRTQGRGAFFELGSLDVGDEIVVRTEDGEQRWEVTGRTSYPKDRLPIEDIFTLDGDPRLVLVTCGGPFDSNTRHYTENIVVYAAPATSG